MFFVPTKSFARFGNLDFPQQHHLLAVNWVRRHHPFWNSSGGADHILFWGGDRGAATLHHIDDGDGANNGSCRLLLQNVNNFVLNYCIPSHA